MKFEDEKIVSMSQKVQFGLFIEGYALEKVPLSIGQWIDKTPSEEVGLGFIPTDVPGGKAAIISL